MKQILVCLIIVSFDLRANCQLLQDITRYYQDYDVQSIRANEKTPFLICAIPNKIKPVTLFRNGKWTPNTKLIEQVSTLISDTVYLNKIKTPFEKLLANFDSSKVPVFAQGINKSNCQLYEFQVRSKSEILIPWKTPNEFIDGTYISGFGSGDHEMAYLGSFSTGWNNYITVEVREKNRNLLISTANIFWLPRFPAIISTFRMDQLNKFLEVFKVYSQNERLPVLNGEVIDALLSKEKVFPYSENGLIFLFSDLTKSNVIEYRLLKNGISGEWQSSSLDHNIIWLKDLLPGKYKLLIRYSVQRHNVTEYEFDIKPAWHQTTIFKIITGSLIAAFFGFILTLIILRKQGKRNIEKQLKKEIIETELKSIRSQFNPHFVFNALSSIQGLMNKNELEAANTYLSEFSNLMRTVLSASDKEFTPLSRELSSLESYIRLEQLRFGFSYTIEVDKAINITETGLPSLLLQPLIENAVKHGVSSLGSSGRIKITLDKRENDLQICISDNGVGLSISTANGYGLKLTNSRIKLLNHLLVDQAITIEFEEIQEIGVTLSLHFKNWF